MIPRGFQVIVYYLKQSPPVDEKDAPYQGKIVRCVPAQPGYLPDDSDIQEYAPPGCETALQVLLSLN